MVASEICQEYHHTCYLFHVALNILTDSFVKKNLWIIICFFYNRKTIELRLIYFVFQLNELLQWVEDYLKASKWQ